MIWVVGAIIAILGLTAVMGRRRERTQRRTCALCGIPFDVGDVAWEDRFTGAALHESCAQDLGKIPHPEETE